MCNMQCLLCTGHRIIGSDAESAGLGGAILKSSKDCSNSERERKKDSLMEGVCLVGECSK